MFRLNGFEAYFKKNVNAGKKCLKYAVLGVASNIKHVPLSLRAINTLRSVDEWRRQVLLPPSRFLDYLSSQKSKKSIFLLHGEYIDNTDKRRKPFDGGVKTQICINLDGIFALGSRNLRSGPILAASIHSLLCGHGQLYDENFSQVKLKLNFIFLIVSKSLT